MAKKGKKTVQAGQDRDLAALEAERIVNKLIEKEPRLKAARQALQRNNNNEANIVESTLRAFRQRLTK